MICHSARLLRRCFHPVGASLVAAIALTAPLTTTAARAQISGTWLPTQTAPPPLQSFYFFDSAANWNTGVTPNGGTAFFATTSGIDNGTNVLIRRDATLGQIEFTTLAPSYNVTLSQASGPRFVQLNNGILNDSSSHQTITLAGGVNLTFHGGSAGGNIDYANRATLSFTGASTAGSATITTNLGGLTHFEQNSNAANATITNNGTVLFSNNSTAGNAAITNTNGGAVADFSPSTGPAGDRKLTAGSIAGVGSFVLGANELTVGGDNMSTEVSGVISGIGGSLVKVGAGTLTLSGPNTYTGGTTINGGSLQLGDGGVLGSIVGDVTDNGTLAFDRGDAVTFAGAISGTGSLNQIGSGSTTLTAANSYSGGTLLAAGTLIAGDNSALGSGALTVAANAAGTTLDNTPAATSLANAIVLNPSANLTVAGSNPLTLTGAVSGDGGLTKNGASTLILTADNSYAGGTTINSGTLQVGDGGATGSVGTGAVLNDASLVFNRSGIVTVPGVISGTGSLTQMGVAGGTLVLTGADTFSGGTTIVSGTLQLGDGGSTGSIIGNVGDSGTLAFNRSDTVTFAGAISGGGAVAQIGSGTTILTADNPYTGGTNVSNGTLVVGDFAHPTAALSGGGAINVGSGGTLGGYGSVTGPVVNDGVIAAGSATPDFIGSPTGTFTIIGSLLNQGVIQLASGESIGNMLDVHGSYVGAGGSMDINTFLGGDGSPPTG